MRSGKALTLTVIPDQRSARRGRPDTVSNPLESTLQPERPQGAGRPGHRKENECERTDSRRMGGGMF